MAGKGLSYIKWQKTSKRCFMTALSSAVLEWLLILMLLMNGAFAYLITWFARYCDLPIPCLLCSRLDHVFGSLGIESYWDLMCKSHKSEISSLVLCSLHEKLVDVHGMCENCLFSYATKDKSNSETYRLLVGKIGLDPENDVDDSPLLGDHKHHSKSTKICCCCNEPWISRSRAQALLHTKSVELEKGDVDVPLTREFRLNWSSSNKENVKPNFLATISSVHESFEDCSPHFGYSELKLSSDTESEDREFELEEPKGFVSELKSIVSESTLLETPNLIDDYIKPRDAIPEKAIVRDVTVAEPPNLIDHELSHSDLNESHQVPSTLPAVVGHGLEELNWQDIDLKTESSPSSDPISTDNVAELPNAADIQVDPSKDHADSCQKDTEGPLEVEQTAKFATIERISEEAKEKATTDVVDTKVNNDVNDGGVQTATNLDLGDAYKLAVSSRGRQLSGKTLEQLLGKDSTRVSEDLKLLLSQLSVARGLDLPLTGIISPRMSGNDYIGMQILQKRFSVERNDSRNSLERNESGFESLDVSIVSDVDGENEIDRLKRQIDHDKKFMSALYKELEEERSASAVAANQALAMITRLQEEKAALQMEALHDLRMMEDQAEYDVEALDRANELLAEKEREIQDLEEELDYYRMKYPNDDLMLEDGSHERKSPKSSWLGFEDEKLYISNRLSNLEKKLHLYSNSGIYSDLQNGDCFNMDEEKDDDDVVLQTNDSTSLGSRRSLVRRVHSLKTPKSHTNQADMVTIGFEVSTLNERLQGLEADRNFLEHAINSLRNGEEGVRFLQEIASHLCELRRVGIKRKQSLA